MKNEIDRLFDQLHRQHHKAFIAYLAGGYPSFSEEKRLFRMLDKTGVSLFEVGVPFSDPIADGPTIQFASQKSLAAGTTLRKILRWIGQIRRSISAPVVLMSYLNPIMAYGPHRFSQDARRVGVSGLIVPDLIPEEGREMERILSRQGIHLIYMVAPTTPASRLKMIARRTRGFLYAVSVAGVTGARRTLSAQTKSWLKSLRRYSDRPICVGFGISGSAQIKKLKSVVDGFIMGSALIDQIRSHHSLDHVNRVRKFILPLIKECTNGNG